MPYKDPIKRRECQRRYDQRRRPVRMPILAEIPPRPEGAPANESYSDSAPNRFWSRVKRSDGCWSWGGASSQQGYGIFWSGYRQVVAHRAAYEMHYGSTLGEMLACHRCDNRNCVRPDHIFAGTQLDNMRDMANKGRKVTARGFDLPHTRLSVNDVLEIVRLCKSGVPNKSIALMYGVDASHVSKIKHGASRVQPL